MEKEKSCAAVSKAALRAIGLMWATGCRRIVISAM